MTGDFTWVDMKTPYGVDWAGKELLQCPRCEVYTDDPAHWCGSVALVPWFERPRMWQTHPPLPDGWFAWNRILDAQVAFAGYLEVGMAQAHEVAHILLDGEKITTCVRLDNIEGWIVMYDKTCLDIEGIPELVRKTGEVEIVWSPVDILGI